TTAHEALDRGYGALGVHRRLAAGELADQTFARLREGDDRGRDPRALRVGDDHRLSALDHSYDGVGGAKIDSDRLRHLVLSRRAVRAVRTYGSRFKQPTSSSRCRLSFSGRSGPTSAS